MAEGDKKKTCNRLDTSDHTSVFPLLHLQEEELLEIVEMENKQTGERKETNGFAVIWFI